MTITFELNSDELTAQSKQTLNTVAKALKSKDLAAQCFQLAGHTCDLGDAPYNMSLSQRRAESAKRYLESQGVDGGRIITTGTAEEIKSNPQVQEAYLGQEAS